MPRLAPKDAFAGSEPRISTPCLLLSSTASGVGSALEKFENLEAGPDEFSFRPNCKPYGFVCMRELELELPAKGEDEAKGVLASPSSFSISSPRSVKSPFALRGVSLLPTSNMGKAKELSKLGRDGEARRRSVADACRVEWVSFGVRWMKLED